MRTGLSLASYKGTRLSATCLNIMAKFVHSARQHEQVDLRLQDKDVLAKIENLASNTSNQQLLRLYHRLENELIKFHAAPTLQGINNTDDKPKSTFGSLFKDWARPFK